MSEPAFTVEAFSPEALYWNLVLRDKLPLGEEWYEEIGPGPIFWQGAIHCLLLSVLTACVTHAIPSAVKCGVLRMRDCMQIPMAALLRAASIGMLLWALLLCLAMFLGGLSQAFPPLLVLLLLVIVLLVCRWILAIPVGVIERCSGLLALGRSGQLTKGGRWGIFGILLWFLLMYMGLSVLVGHWIPTQGYKLAANFLISLPIHAWLAALIGTLYFEFRRVEVSKAPQEGSGNGEKQS